jgi:hypothetical protein
LWYRALATVALLLYVYPFLQSMTARVLGNRHAGSRTVGRRCGAAVVVATPAPMPLGRTSCENGWLVAVENPTDGTFRRTYFSRSIKAGDQIQRHDHERLFRVTINEAPRRHGFQHHGVTRSRTNEPPHHRTTGASSAVASRAATSRCARHAGWPDQEIPRSAPPAPRRRIAPELSRIVAAGEGALPGRLICQRCTWCPTTALRTPAIRLERLEQVRGSRGRDAVSARDGGSAMVTAA